MVEELENALVEQMDESVQVENGLGEPGKRLIVVMGRTAPTLLAVVRALGEAGHPVDVVYVTVTKGRVAILTASKYVRNAVEINEFTDAALLLCLESGYAGCAEKPILIATDDFTASFMDKNTHRLGSKFIMPHLGAGKGGEINEMMDKFNQAQLAEAAGLKVAKTWEVDLLNLIEPTNTVMPMAKGTRIYCTINVPDDITFPCFVKPAASWAGRKTEMKACCNKLELYRHLLTMRKKQANRKAIVQEFLDIEDELCTAGAAMDQDIVIPSIFKKLVVSKYDKGVTLVGETHEPSIIGDSLAKLENMLRSMHYVGLFDVDFILCRGELYFSELNLRSSGVICGAVKSGVNLPEMVVRKLLDEDYSDLNRVATPGLRFLNDRTGWDDYAHSYITLEALDRYREEADFCFVYDTTDPEPHEVYAKDRMALRKRLTRDAKWSRRLGAKRYRGLKRKASRVTKLFKKSGK